MFRNTQPKRERAKKFIQNENELLINISLQYTDIIENKKNDQFSILMKDGAWKIIAEIFNENSDYVERTASALRSKYIGLKKELMKKQAEEREYAQTAPNNKLFTYTDYENKLLEIINNGKCSIGTANQSHCDSDYSDQTSNNTSENGIELLNLTPAINKVPPLLDTTNQLKSPRLNTIKKENRISPLAQPRNELFTLQKQIGRDEQLRQIRLEDEKLKMLRLETQHKVEEHKSRMKLYELELESKLREKQRLDEEHTIKMNILQLELQQTQCKFEYEHSN